MGISDSYLKRYINRLYIQIKNHQPPSLHLLFNYKEDRDYAGLVRDSYIYRPTGAYELQRVRHLQAKYLDLLTRFSMHIEMRDSCATGHTTRLSRYAVAIAKALCWRHERIEEMELGAYLHDIGKICVSESILNKNGRLTSREFKQVKRHVWIGASMIMKIDFLRPLIPFILYHHERYDGKGYPFKLGGKEIPIEGRIMAVIDTYDALVNQRPYRSPISDRDAIDELSRQKGYQLDPDLVDIFIDVLRKGIPTA